MISLESFQDEMEKISAQKCRKGSMPIRAHNLAEKDSYDGRGKTRTKLAKVNPKTMARAGLVGGGAVGALTLEQMIKDWQLGRRVRKQQG